MTASEERFQCMWAHEYTRDTSASPQAVWGVLRSCEDWSWDTSTVAVQLRNMFRVDSQERMTPAGPDTIMSVHTKLVDHELYADVTQMGPITVRISHTLFPLNDGGTRIVHRLEITGPAAEQVGPERGPAITEQFPEAMGALISSAIR